MRNTDGPVLLQGETTYCNEVFYTCVFPPPLVVSLKGLKMANLVLQRR